MVVQCETCRRRYDDASRWTICPHNSLRVRHDAVYCRRHDFYNCTLCAPGVPLLQGIADQLQPRSIAWDIVRSAMFHLEGEPDHGHAVARWWLAVDLSSVPAAADCGNCGISKGVQ